MSGEIRLASKMVALLHGERSAAAVEAYRRAGGEVYDLADAFDRARLEWSAKGLNAWTAPHSSQVALLASWNAFALQVLGDELVAADYAADPTTAGFLPPVTARQALAFYGPVPAWLSAVREAQSSEEYRLQVAVPAALPPFVEVEPCPPAHLTAMKAAAARLRTQAEATLAGFTLGDGPDQHQARDAMERMTARAGAAMDYASRLWAPHVPTEVHVEIERHLRAALEDYFELGQWLAMPSLALGPRSQPTRVADLVAPRPSTASFDKWSLTDPQSRARWQRDPAARQAIQILWANDPDPQATLQIQAEVDAALAAGDVAYATDTRGERIGHYFCCPWSAVYVVRRPVVIGGRHLRQLEEFTFDVSAEDVKRGGPFKREVLVARFHPTEEVDYCNPDE